jgi:cell division protein FtsA
MRGAREITAFDRSKVIDVAKTIKLPPDRQIIHVLPQFFLVDGVKCRDPVNMMGLRLEGSIHIITAAITSMLNIERSLKRAGYVLAEKEMTLKTLAATQAVMTEEEMNLGSILIDLGGGTTDVLVLYEGAPVCTFSTNRGASLITDDIAHGERVSFDTAERIKLRAGTCWEGAIDEAALTGGDVLIPGAGGRPPQVIPRLDLARIIRARQEETIQYVKQEIIRLGAPEKLDGNIVLTGGGALLPGIVDLTKEVFNTNAVRIGYPHDLGIATDDYRSPEWATATGLMIDAMNKDREEPLDAKGKRGIGRLFDLLRGFF